MTIFLILGLFAGLYMVWLLFSLAVYALPVATAISLALWMHAHEHGIVASILAGFAAGIAILIIGQFLFAVSGSPIIRLGLAALFAFPAGVAGYHAVHGLARFAIEPGVLLSVLSWGGGFAIAVTAWTRLASFGAETPQSGRLISTSEG